MDLYLGNYVMAKSENLRLDLTLKVQLFALKRIIGVQPEQV
jgi:hypothetical protein